MAVRRRLVLRPADAGRVLSPVRLELLSAIGLHGPCSARELATRLGRSVTSLYYHLGLLARVGAVSQRRRGSETVWQVTAQEVTVGSRRSVAAGIATAASTKAALRLTSREVEAALRDPSLRRGEPSRRLVAARSKAWLDEAQLGAIDRHIAAILDILCRAPSARRGAAIYAVTLVLAPVRERRAASP